MNWCFYSTSWHSLWGTTSHISTWRLPPAPATRMVSLEQSWSMWLLEREYDIKAEQRAVRNEHLRDQHNRTSCRSPSREADVLWFKQEQRHKRQLEFAKRRPTGVGATKFKVASVRRPTGTRLGPLARETLTSTRRPLITRGSMGIPEDDVKSSLQVYRALLFITKIS